MKTVSLSFTLLACIVTALAACSKRQVYDAVQRNQQLDCQRYPDTRYEECMQQSDMSYDEYKAAREAVDPGRR